jgi:hypothetical protein
LEKHSESRLSYHFAHLPLLSSDLFSSDSFHHCFSTVHIVGSFTSKLPSIIIIKLIIIIIGRNPLGLAPPGLEESGPPSAAVTAPTVAPDGPLVAGDHLGTDLSDDGYS